MLQINLFIGILSGILSGFILMIPHYLYSDTYISVGCCLSLTVLVLGILVVLNIYKIKIFKFIDDDIKLIKAILVYIKIKRIYRYVLFVWGVSCLNILIWLSKNLWYKYYFIIVTLGISITCFTLIQVSLAIKEVKRGRRK